MFNYKYALILLLTLSWHGSAVAVNSPQVSMNVAAESVARVVVYYRNLPITGNGIDFPLPIDGLSQHFERTSDLFYVVGNVAEAEVLFSDSAFVLLSSKGKGKINLVGDFIYQNTLSSALVPLQVPVIKNINEATVATGFKVHFKSDFLAGNYTQGTYANSFTLLVKPIP